MSALEQCQSTCSSGISLNHLNYAFLLAFSSLFHPFTHSLPCSTSMNMTTFSLAVPPLLLSSPQFLPSLFFPTSLHCRHTLNFGPSAPSLHTHFTLSILTCHSNLSPSTLSFLICCLILVLLVPLSPATLFMSGWPQLTFRISPLPMTLDIART